MKLSLVIGAITLPFLYASSAWSGDVLHEGAFSYLFGNHIDTHQDTKLKLDKNGNVKKLMGRFYIIFTGDTNDDGVPIARHPRGAGNDEVCGVDSIDCVVGWTIKALPGKAKFLYHKGVNGDDHPVWLVNRVDIPQPGSYTHFHWITSDSTDPRSRSVPVVCDQKNAGELESMGAANTVCPGWFLQIRAVEEFVFEHGGEKILVTPGVDNATHLNLVTNYAEVWGITGTR